MRRVLAITLMIALFGPGLASSLSTLTADPESNLPACCRSHGVHHCAMMHWMLDAQNAKPRFTQAPCPLYPVAATLPQIATFVLAGVPENSREQLRASGLTVAESRRAHLFPQSAHTTRGPPTAA